MNKKVILGVSAMIVALFVFFHAILTPNIGVYRVYIAPSILIASLLFSAIMLVLHNKKKNKFIRENFLKKENEKSRTCYICTNSIKKGEKFLKTTGEQYFHEACGYDPM